MNVLAKVSKNAANENRIKKLELEKQLLEKELEIEKLKLSIEEDHSSIIQALSEEKVEDFNGETISLDYYFYFIRKIIAKSLHVSDKDQISDSLTHNQRRGFFTNLVILSQGYSLQNAHVSIFFCLAHFLIEQSGCPHFIVLQHLSSGIFAS